MDSTAGRRLLLVEDDRILVMTQTALLRQRGYEVVAAESGEAAVGLFTARPDVELVLMDIDLGSGIDGIETARRILAQRELPVLFLSGHTEPEVVGKTEAVSSYGYVAKQSGITVLDAAIKMAFRLNAARREIESQRALQAAMIDGIPDAVFVKDAAGRYLLINQAGAAMLGLTPAEVVGRTDHEFLPAALADEFRATDQQILSGGVPVDRVEQGELDGRPVVFLARKRPWLDAAGRPAGIIGLSRDITEDERVAAALRDSGAELRKQNELFATLLKVLPIGVFMVEAPSGRPLLANEAALGLLGRGVVPHADSESLPEVYRAVRMPGRQTYPPEDMPVVHGMQGIASRVDDMAVERPDGSLVRLEVQGTPVRDHDGRIWASLVAFTDITERSRAEEREHQARERTERLLAILQYPAASIQDFLDYALQQAIEMTGSAIGYIYHYHEDRRQFVLNTWSKGVMDACRVVKPSTTYDLDATGFWGEAVRQRRPIINNDFAAGHPWKKGVPAGHVALSRFMTLPVFEGERIVGVVGLGNKGTDYGDDDIAQVGLLMEAVWNQTARMRAEQRIKDLLAEKETILKEVHHRIKNNLQTVEGMLLIQAQGAGNPAVAEPLVTAASRVRSMHELYRRLYESPEAVELESASYLEPLVRTIVSNFPQAEAVALELELGGFRLDAVRLQRIGIFINEAVTNAMKHAFRERGGRLRVAVTSSGAAVRIEVADDGPGWADAAAGRAQGFGMSLMSMLAEQLGGSLAIEHGAGCRTVLCFPP